MQGDVSQVSSEVLGATAGVGPDQGGGGRLERGVAGERGAAGGGTGPGSRAARHGQQIRQAGKYLNRVKKGSNID